MAIPNNAAPHNITHVLDRLSLGASPGDRNRIQNGSLSAYIRNQLNPNVEAEPKGLTDRLTSLPDLARSPVELFDRYAPPQGASPEENQKARLQQVQMLRQFEQARLLRGLASPNQLQEVMVDFWFNHFNVFVGKRFTMIWAGDYDQSAIRPHALGNFRTLLGATAKHPAMLFYLDNWRSSNPAKKLRRPFQGLNENYARELLELHTLGVEGGYTQADVESLARILTGWSIVSHRQRGRDNSGFVYANNRHDPTRKVLLGQPISASGQAEGEEALDILAAHPATARHISYKLAQHFVADDPPQSLVKQLSETFLSTDGDIRAVLSTLFESPEFWSPDYSKKKFKTPYHYLLSMARAIGIRSLSEDKLKRLSGGMAQLGMPLYRRSTPDGYPQTQAAWLSPDAMLKRVNLAITTVNLLGEERPKPVPLTNQLLDTLGRRQFSAETLEVVNTSPPHLRPALLLGSPEMMYR
ncbi:MAG: DUF1800 domain-containing protein [Phormidesmis sp.]